MKRSYLLLSLAACCFGGCGDTDGIYSTEPSHETYQKTGLGTGPARYGQAPAGEGDAPGAAPLDPNAPPPGFSEMPGLPPGN